MDEALNELLIGHEGWEETPYQDHLGNWTVGVGHLMTRPLSDKAIAQILEDDIQGAKDDLDRKFPRWCHLGQSQQLVLVSMMFQMGSVRYNTFVLFWQAIESGDWQEAKAQMLDSKWARQTPKRANELALMIEIED